MSQSSYPIGGQAERTAAKGWAAPPPALAMAVLLVCAVQLTSYVRAAQADGRTGSLAGLNAKVGTLAYELDSERDSTILFIALTTGPQGARARSWSPAAKSELKSVRQQYAITDKWIGTVSAGLSAIGAGYPRGVLLGARSVVAEASFVGSVRRAALSPQASAVDVLNRYSTVINVLLAFENEVGRNSSDSQVFATVSAMSQVSRVEQEYSVQRSLIAYGLTAGAFAPNMLRELEASLADQSSAGSQFQNFASTQQMQYYQVALVSGSDADRVGALEHTVLRYMQGHKALTGVGISPDEWIGNVTQTLSKVRSVELRLNSEVQQHAQGLQRSALTATAIFSALIVLLMAFVAVVLRPLIASLRRRRGPSQRG
jgi:nitrate/nitrite sensing protein